LRTGECNGSRHGGVESGGHAVCGGWRWNIHARRLRVTPVVMLRLRLLKLLRLLSLLQLKQLLRLQSVQICHLFQLLVDGLHRLIRWRRTPRRLRSRAESMLMRYAGCQRVLRLRRGLRGGIWNKVLIGNLIGRLLTWLERELP